MLNIPSANFQSSFVWYLQHTTPLTVGNLWGLAEPHLDDSVERMAKAAAAVERVLRRARKGLGETG